MTRRSLLKSLLIAPFAGLVGKKVIVPEPIVERAGLILPAGYNCLTTAFDVVFATGTDAVPPLLLDQKEMEWRRLDFTGQFLEPYPPDAVIRIKYDWIELP